MLVLDRLAELQNKRKPIVLAAGFFDGVHGGHRQVLRAALDRARALNAAAWAMTFAAHPLTVLNPSAAPALLTSTPHKLRLFAALGFDGCLVLPFTRALAEMAPEIFAARLHENVPALRHLCAGRNWRFGKGGRGTPNWLANRARAMGWTVSVVEPATVRGRRISSSWIRAAVARGRLGEAESLLGRPFSVWGAVVPGRAVGRRLGAPTANLALRNVVLPPHGVYAARVNLDPGKQRGRMANGILHWGMCPTFSRGRSAEPVLEVHLLDIDQDIYGREIEAIFIRKLRKERRFPSEKALAEHIRGDIGRARRVLAEHAQKNNAI